MNYYTQLLQPVKSANGFLEKLRSSLGIRIAWVWAMVFVGIVLYSMMWFVFGRMVFEVITAMEAGYTFTGEASSVVELIKLVIAYHPVFALIGWLVWGYINSSRRDVRSYESY